MSRLRRISVSNQGFCLLGSIAVFCVLTGCVTPPSLVPAFSEQSLPVLDRLAKDCSELFVVDAEVCRHESDDFNPQGLAFAEVGLVDGQERAAALPSLLPPGDVSTTVCVLVHGYGFDRARSIEDARWAVDRADPRRALGVKR